MRRFEGKTVIVTGGSSGIGEAASRAFSAEGANVVIVCLPGEESGKKVAAEISAGGGKAIQKFAGKVQSGSRRGC